MKRDLLDPVGLACAGVVTLTAAIISTTVFGRIPHVQDSIAQLFQARIFAHGRLWMPTPPLPEFFQYAHVINDGRWYAQYPPGHSLLLVPGIWLGAPWLVNPLLGGLSVLGVFQLTREAFGVVAARAAAVLAMVSPFLVLMASEFMAHASGLFAITWFLVFALRSARTGNQRDASLGGAFLLLAVLIRPYTALAVALPVLIHAGWRLASLRRHNSAPGEPAPSPRAFLLMAAGGLAGILLYGLYNWGTTGDPWTPGYIRLYGPSHGLGFGRGSWGPPHTLSRGLHHAAVNLKALNRDLFAWPVTSLWPLLVGLIPASVASRSSAGIPGGSEGRGAGAVAPIRPSPGTRALLAGVPVSLLLFYVFYWYNDLCFGPRYLYEALGPILALSGLGLIRTADRLARMPAWLRRGRRNPGRTGKEEPGTPCRSLGWWIPLAVLGASLAVYAGLAGWPRLFRAAPGTANAAPATPVRMGSYFQHYGRSFWGVSPSLGEIVEERVQAPALVFVRLREIEPNNPQVRHLWFGSAFARLDPDFQRTRIIYAKDRGADDARLVKQFPGRTAYVYTGTIEGGTVELWHPEQ